MLLGAQFYWLVRIYAIGTFYVISIYLVFGNTSGRLILQTEHDLPRPVHHWKLDGNTVDDVSGVVGNIEGSAEFSTTVHAQGSSSLRFECCDAKVVLNDPRLKDAFTDYTVSLWFQVDEIFVPGFRYLFEEGGARNGFAIRIGGSRVEVAVLEGGRKVEKASIGRIIPKHWHHVVGTYSNGTISVFLDGKQGAIVQTNFGQLAAHGNAASIGGGGLLHQQTASNLVGFVDDIRIWDEIALSEAQVSRLYDTAYAQQRPNFLLIVADDLNFDSLGFMGGVAPQVSPNIDQLASESQVFSRTHAATSVCQPSRQAMLSGNYPPNYGAVGFNPMEEGTPTVVSKLSIEGYLTATFHKFWHMRPFSSFPWAMTEENTMIQGRSGTKRIGRAPTLLAEATRKTIEASKANRQPFFLVINSADTHRPFPGDSVNARFEEKETLEDPSRFYDPSEVTLPRPIPDLPDARKDIARYASSVRRLDDTVGRCLEALAEFGMENNTVVMFVSDNGMPMPFGKFETYRDSIRGPMIVRWPGVLKPTMDNTTLVSLTDVAPTILEMAGASALTNIDGRSLIPLINKKPGLRWRDVVVGTRYEDIYYGHAINNRPNAEALREKLRSEGWVDASGDHKQGTMKRTMNKRGITDGVYHYIYNHFYDAETRNSTTAIPYEGGTILKAMKEVAASGDLAMSERLDFYLHRAQEEFYDTQSDPGSENNLIDEEMFQPQVAMLRQKLLGWMIETNDPVIDDYASLLSTY